MKQLPLILLAIVSIALGIWMGLNPNEQTTGSSGKYDHLGGDFTLQSDKGPVSLSDFKGKVVPIYFGFTHCPDVCITSLNKITAALKSLPEDEHNQIQPLFITVDPERDDVKKVSEYARYFDPKIIGLSGSPDEIARVAQRYLVIYEKVKLEDSAMDYTMDHSSVIYVVGRNGKIASLVHHADTAEALVKYLQEALKR